MNTLSKYILSEHKFDFTDIYGTEQRLITRLIRQKGGCRLTCTLEPAGEYAESPCFEYKKAQSLYNIISSENVLPLQLLEVLEDMDI